MLSFMTQCQSWLAQSPVALAYLTEKRFLTLDTIFNDKIGFFPSDANYVHQDGFPRSWKGLGGELLFLFFLSSESWLDSLEEFQTLQ